MAERTKALVSKTSMGVISSWVRIPLSPPQRNRNSQYGEMLEWPNRRDWKSRVPSQGEPWVRIPLSPPKMRGVGNLNGFLMNLYPGLVMEYFGKVLL